MQRGQVKRRVPHVQDDFESRIRHEVLIHTWRKDNSDVNEWRTVLPSGERAYVRISPGCVIMLVDHDMLTLVCKGEDAIGQSIDALKWLGPRLGREINISVEGDRESVRNMLGAIETTGEEIS